MSHITLRIPAPLRSLSGGRSEIIVRGTDITEVLDNLRDQNEELADRILDGNGMPRPFVNLFLDNQNIRDLAGLRTPVARDSVLHVIPAVAGGT